MYLLLRGSLPFDSYIPDEVIDNTLKGNFSLSDDHWDKISPSAKDLISKLLKVNPAERITIKDALCHQWLKDREPLKKLIGICRE